MYDKKIMVVGYGYWGPNLVRNLRNLFPQDQIVICDTMESARTRAQKDYPGISFYSDPETAFSDDAIGAVLIAAPVEQHSGLAALALRNGKNVLVEKPLTSNVKDAVELISIAKEQKKVLMAGHTFLYSQPVIKIKDLIENHNLGDVRYITSSRINLGIHRKDVSVVWDLASHDISILCYWLDEFPTSVSTFATCTAGQFPDVAFINLKFPSGVIGNVQVSWIAPTKVRRLTLVASEKMVLYEDTDPEEPVKVFDKGVYLKDPTDFGEYQLMYRTGDILSPRIEPKEPLREEIMHFIGCINDGTKPLTDGDFGMRVVAVLEAAEKSWQNDGKVVEVSFG